GAAELISMLMLEPPKVPPPGVVAAQRDADLADISHHARSAIPNYLVMAGFLPVIVANGVRSWPSVLGLTAVALVLAAAAYRLMRQPARPLWWMIFYAALNAASLALIGRLAGALTFVP